MTGELLKPQYEILIFTIRGVKVMIDSDLALLYGVPTKALKQQVRRNLQRFPGDFMFELSMSEQDELVTNCDRLRNLRHSSIGAMAFTEQGVAMLSSVLRSDKAINVNIEIMRAFARYRSLLNEHIELRKEIKQLDKKLNLSTKFLLDKIDALHYKKTEPRTQIGFKRKNS